MTTDSAPSSVSTERPIPITIMCVICGIGVVAAIPMIFKDTARSIGVWYPFCLAASVIIGAACMVGFWLMRRWALQLYTAMFVINQIVLLATGLWSVMSLILPAIVVGIGFAYYGRMR